MFMHLGLTHLFSCMTVLNTCKYLIWNSKVDAYITNLQGQCLFMSLPHWSPYITKKKI